MPDDVRLISDTGQAVTVDPTDAEYYLRQGFRPEGGGDIVQAADKAVLAERQANRGALDQVGAAFHGFMSGATFGGSKVLEEGLGFSRDEQKALEQDFAKTNAVSELAGAIVPALVPGGQGSILKALPAGRAALMGERIAQVGEGASAWRKIGALAKAGAAEGAVQTGGQYLSSVALGDRDLSAEAFMAEAGKGALLGGAIGGGLGAAEQGFIAARKLIPKSMGGKAELAKAADNVDAELTKALDGTERAQQAARDKLEALRLQRADLDVAAQAKVAERRAAEAAQAEQKLATQRELDAIKLDRAKNPPARAPRTRKPGAAADDLAPVEPLPTSAAPDKPVQVDVVAAPDVPPVTAAPTPAAPQTWREFQASRMGEYMKTEGGHAGAMKRIGAEWRAYKSGAVADTAASAASAADEGGDLLAQLAATKSKLDAGEAFGGMAQRRPVVDEIHEAMAELDPEAAAIVNAAKAHEAAAEKIRSRFTIRDRNGTHRVEIPEMAEMTLGRVKQAYTVANDAEKAAILETIGPERAKALTEIVEGRATFDKWYKNKNHWYEDPSYRAQMEPIGPAPDDLAVDFADGTSPGFEGATMSADDFADVDSMNRAAADLAEYEQTMASLVEQLGPAAPADLVETATKHAAAVDAHADDGIARMAQIADDMPTAPAAPAAVAEAPAPIVRDVAGEAAQVAASGDPLKAAALVSLPGANGLAGAAKAAGGRAGLLADLGAANEALQAVGINTPFNVKDIPVIGPIASAYLKLRAALTVAKKAGFRVPLVGDAAVAAGSSRARDRVAESVEKMLAGGARAAGRANTAAGRMGAVQALPRAAEALRARLYDDGQKRPAPKSDVDALRARLAELEAATANPAGVAATVRQNLRNVKSAGVVDAVAAVAQRKLAYLAKHAPTPPIAAPLSRAQWRPAPAEIDRFARRVRAANDPIGVLDDVSRGVVTAEAVDTLREVYPRLYEEARAHLLLKAPDVREALPHQLVVRMSALFDVPLISSMEPETIAAIQAIAPLSTPPAGGPPSSAMTPAPGGAPNVSDMFMTGADRRAR
jgi:hypothetical protein